MPAPPNLIGCVTAERDVIERILANPANDLETRSGAAERLLAMGRRAAIDVLDEGLRQGDTGTRLAILAAMGKRPSAEPALLDAAVAALATADATILDSLASFISFFNHG